MIPASTLRSSIGAIQSETVSGERDWVQVVKVKSSYEKEMPLAFVLFLFTIFLILGATR